MNNRTKTIIIIASCVVCAIVAIISAYFIKQNYDKEQETLKQQQLVSDVLTNINNIYSDFAMAEDDRLYRVSLYNILIDYQEQLLTEGPVNEEIYTLLDTVLSSMRSAFTDTYSEMISKVADAASSIINEKQGYIDTILEDVNNISERFSAVETSINLSPAVASNNKDLFPGREERINILQELTAQRDAFAEDTYIADIIGGLGTYLAELDNIKSVIESDDVLTGLHQAQSLYGRIETHKATYTNEIENNGYDNVLLLYDAALSNAENWFSGFYLQVIREITETKGADDNDIQTIEWQIAMLKALQVVIDAEDIIDTDDLDATIKTQIDELDKDRTSISERLQRDRPVTQPPVTTTPGTDSGGNTGNDSGSNTGSGNTLVNIEAFADEVFRLVNQVREDEGLPALSPGSALLQEAARIRANECIVSFSHTRPDGTSCFTAYTGTYRALGENIAVGYGSPEAVMKGWLESPGHRENILRSDFTELGVGVVQDSRGRYYWAQMFKG